MRRPGESVEDFVVSMQRTRAIMAYHLERLWADRHDVRARGSVRQNLAAQRWCRDRIRAALAP